MTTAEDPKTFWKKDLYTIKIFEERNDDDQPVVISSGPSGADVRREVFRIRCKDVVKVVGKDYEGVYTIQKQARVMITFVTSDEVDEHAHCFIDFLGTASQVKTAKALWKERLKEVYGGVKSPTAFMSQNMSYVVVPVDDKKVLPDILELENDTCAWVKIDESNPREKPTADGKRVLTIYADNWDRIVLAWMRVQNAPMSKEGEIMPDYHYQEDIKWGAIFGKAQKDIPFFKSWYDRVYRTMVSLIMGYAALVIETRFLANNNINRWGLCLLSVFGYLSLMAAGLLERGWAYIGFYCLAVAIEASLLSFGALIGKVPWYALPVGACIGIMVGAGFFIKAMKTK